MIVHVSASSSFIMIPALRILFRRVKFDRRANFPSMNYIKSFVSCDGSESKSKGGGSKLVPRVYTSWQYFLSVYTRFKTRYKISLRRSTNTAQKQPSDKEAAIQEFHRQIREVQAPGKGDGRQEEWFKLCQIANVAFHSNI